jgi:F-type H+-transporting ATPase subunit b
MKESLFYLDPKFWLAISFTIFILILLKYVAPIILNNLNNKRFKIIENLKNSEEARLKAEKLLLKAQQYYDDSIKYCDQLIKDTELETNNIIEHHNELVKKEIDKKIAAAEDRIKSGEDKIIRDIKSKIISSAITSISANLDKISDKNVFSNANKEAISKISSKLIN